MKKILEINEKPKLLSYAHHSYTNAIVEKSYISSFCISDISLEKWDIKESDILWTYDRETGIVNLFEKRGRSSTTFGMERRCDDTDEVIVNLLSIKLLDSMSNICIGISEAGKTCNKQTAECFCYWNQYDITTNNGHISYSDHFYLYYKLSRNKNKLQISVSNNKLNWVTLQEHVCNFGDSKEYNFFVQFYYGGNQYEKWLNMNYIQLFYDESDFNSVFLDYYVFPRKGSDAGFQHLCQFLDTEYIDFALQKELENKSINEFIRNSIIQDYYVNICTNEYYIQNRQAYGLRDFMHYNLFYGFDDIKKEYNIMGYNARGKLLMSTIPYNLFETPIYDKNMVRYKYKVNTCEYNFQISYIIEMLKEYLEGIDSSKNFAGLMSNRKGIYGLKIFDKLLYTERGQKLMLSDRRISFVLYEHCYLMRDRILYLYSKGYIHTDKLQEIFGKCVSMLKTSAVLKNLVIKFSFQSNNPTKIFSYLIKLKNQERDFLECLINHLVSFDNTI